MDFTTFYDELVFDVGQRQLGTFSAKEGDTNSRGLYVTVIQGGVMVDKLDGLDMVFYFEKPDHTRGLIKAEIENSRFKINYTNQVFAVPGIVECELRLYGTLDEVISSKTFRINVDSNLVDDALVSKDERIYMDDAFKLIEDVIPRIEMLDIELLEKAPIKEAERIEAENLRQAYEADRESNETSRLKNESIREAEELDRQARETERVSSESERLQSEESRNLAELERADQETLRQDRESERALKEIGREANELQRNKQENDRKLNEDSRLENEAQRETNESSRIAEEDTRISSEDQRKTSESDRIASEDLRESQESDRISAESARATAEKSREDSEILRQQGEDQRVESESLRSRQEEDRELNEASRVEDENARKAAEDTRVAGEDARTTSETAREEAENLRVDNETTRELNETERLSKESERQTNEAQRVTNEDARVSNMSIVEEWITNPEQFDGRNIEYSWDGSRLGVRLEGDTTYDYVDLRGPAGELKNLSSTHIRDALGFLPLDYQAGDNIGIENGIISVIGQLGLTEEQVKQVKVNTSLDSEKLGGNLPSHYETKRSKGIADGYASLDSNTKIPLSQLPDTAKQQTYVVQSIGERDALKSLIMGEKCYLTSTGDSYIWDGTAWIVLAKADWENINLQWGNIVSGPTSDPINIDDAVSQRHTHENKGVIDSITSGLINKWNDAWDHISDTVKHITASERAKWNTVDDKADKTYVDDKVKTDVPINAKFTDTTYTAGENIEITNSEISAILKGDGIEKGDVAPEGIEEGRLWLDTSDNSFQDTIFEGKASKKYVDDKINSHVLNSIVVEDLENDKKYVIGIQLSVEGDPQLIYKEVI